MGDEKKVDCVSWHEDVGHYTGLTIEQCKTKCEFNQRCKSFGFGLKRDAGQCFLKSLDDHNCGVAHPYRTMYFKIIPEGYIAPGECIPPYFPQAPQSMKELKMCHPEWIEAKTYYQLCPKDVTCQTCMTSKDRTKAKTYLKALSDNKDTIRESLKEILDELGIKDGGLVIFQMLNQGYYYQWANYVCGCDHHGFEIRDKTLIVVFDDITYDMVKEAGFAVYQPDWMPQVVDENAAGGICYGCPQ
eukprot:UN32407